MTLSAGVSSNAINWGGLLKSAAPYFTSGLGALSGMLTNAYSAHKASDLAILQSQLQKKFAKYTGENAHQWEVKDLRNAGLNPVLSANSGQTYSTGSFSTPFSGAQNPVSSAKEGLDSMLAYRSTMANVENTSANTQKVYTENDLVKENIDKVKADRDLIRSQITVNNAEKALKKAQTWRQYHQALGFSKTESGSRGYSGKRFWFSDSSDNSYSNSISW